MGNLHANISISRYLRFIFSVRLAIRHPASPCVRSRNVNLGDRSRLLCERTDHFPAFSVLRSSTNNIDYRLPLPATWPPLTCPSSYSPDSSPTRSAGYTHAPCSPSVSSSPALAVVAGDGCDSTINLKNLSIVQCLMGPLSVYQLAWAPVNPQCSTLRGCLRTVSSRSLLMLPPVYSSQRPPRTLQPPRSSCVRVSRTPFCFTAPHRPWTGIQRCCMPPVLRAPSRRRKSSRACDRLGSDVARRPCICAYTWVFRVHHPSPASATTHGPAPPSLSLPSLVPTGRPPSAPLPRLPPSPVPPPPSPPPYRPHLVGALPPCTRAHHCYLLPVPVTPCTRRADQPPLSKRLITTLNSPRASSPLALTPPPRPSFPCVSPLPYSYRAALEGRRVLLKGTRLSLSIDAATRELDRTVADHLDEDCGDYVCNTPRRRRRTRLPLALWYIAPVSLHSTHTNYAIYSLPDLSYLAQCRKLVPDRVTFRVTSRYLPERG